MTAPLARIALALALACGTGPALAGASSGPFQPDPALRTASRADIEARFRRTCQATQAKLQSTPEAELVRPCGCYASRTLRALDAGELDAYRSTGVFNDTARGKALAAVDACRLRRPV